MRTQQDRTARGYNLHICDAYDCDDDGWPLLMPVDAKPKALVTFEVATADKHQDDFCHFFIDDYRFKRVWNQPERYVETLRKYAGVLSPDFSMYTDMPLPMQAWNSYRSKALARYWQESGITVIPTLCWSDERSYEFAFRGIPQRSTVAVSTVGVMRSREARRMFEQGLKEAIAQLLPQRVLWYGKAIDMGPLGTEVAYYDNDNHRRVKSWEAGERHRETRVMPEGEHTTRKCTIPCQQGRKTPSRESSTSSDSLV